MIGKTNIKASKEGENIGFSFYFVYHNSSCSIFKNKNRNYQF